LRSGGVILAFMAAFAASTAFAAPLSPSRTDQSMAADAAAGPMVHPSLPVAAPIADSVPIVLIPPVRTFSASELENVALHVRNSLTGDLYDNFQLFLYVSKAESGPWAQHMFVLAKKPDGTLAVLQDWPVSTGRELNEANAAGTLLPSFTPEGYYQFDPARMYTSHRSGQWGDEMPYAMFFNWTRDGRETGLAIHAATDDEVSLLGTRASAGCVRLSPQAAQDLFTLVQAQYRGSAPVFEAYARNGATGNGGGLHFNADGSFQLADGYKVLVFIEDFSGEASVASLR
jgi:lipoprotein-anchoring transpeptidase ErfK/SrfK